MRRAAVQGEKCYNSSICYSCNSYTNKHNAIQTKHSDNPINHKIYNSFCKTQNET